MSEDTMRQLAMDAGKEAVAYAEWIRNRIGPDTQARILVKGNMGPKEIGNLIIILEAQKKVLEDE